MFPFSANPALQGIARLFWLAVSAGGIMLTAAEIYFFPVHGAVAFSVAFFSTLLFGGLFILLKLRFALPGLAVMSLIVFNPFNFDKIMFNFRAFADFFLLRLDSRLLYTARYSTRGKSDIDFLTSVFDAGVEYTGKTKLFADGVSLSFIVVCIAIGLIFALFSRHNFIGGVLATAFLVIVPAFGAETARFVPGFAVLIVAMFALYGMWSGTMFSSRGAVKTKPKKKSVMGGIPEAYRNGGQGTETSLIAALCAVVALAVSATVIPPGANIKFGDGLQSAAISIAGLAGSGGTPLDIFRANFVGINDRGYFSDFSDNTGNLSMGSPSVGQMPVFRITASNRLHPIYFRAGIGGKFDSANFRMTYPPSEELELINELQEIGFYPELESVIFRDAASLLGIDPNNYFGVQEVGIDYMALSNVALFPMTPAMTDYYKDERFTRKYDTVLRAAKDTRLTHLDWEILYPKMNNDFQTGFKSILPNIDVVSADTDDMLYIKMKQGGELSHGYFRFAPGLTAGEYMRCLALYREQIKKIYTVTSEPEAENIAALKAEMADIVEWGKAYYEPNMEPYTLAYFTEKYFRENYDYSLTTNNRAGDNTELGNFLFGTKSGYCSYFAAAMTELLRSEGIPARFVTGYVLDPDQTELKNLDNGRFEATLYERNLHAWVEVYFENVGWIPYDPTPAIYGSGVPGERTPGAEQRTGGTEKPDEPEDTGESDAQPNESAEDAAESAHAKNVTAAAATAAAGAVIAGVIALLVRRAVSARRRIFRILSPGNSYVPENSRRTARQLHALIKALLKFRNLRPLPEETLSEFAARVTESFGDAFADSSTAEETECEVTFTEAANVILKAEFSGEEEAVTEEELSLLRKFAAELFYREAASRKAPARFIRMLKLSRVDI
ncbi:hypothetical protein FACS189499_08430 [Clostridia bacterium]|nr:hypothetical protein FACS189499_08430 [Clostridia bacterium]